MPLYQKWRIRPGLDFLVAQVKFQNPSHHYSFNGPSSPEKVLTVVLGVGLSPILHTIFDTNNYGMAHVFYMAPGCVTSYQYFTKFPYSGRITQRSCLRGLQRVLGFLNAVSNLGCHISLSPTRGVSSRWHLVLGHSS